MPASSTASGRISLTLGLAKDFARYHFTPNAIISDQILSLPGLGYSMERWIFGSQIQENPNGKDLARENQVGC